MNETFQSKLLAGCYQKQRHAEHDKAKYARSDSNYDIGHMSSLQLNVPSDV